MTNNFRPTLKFVWRTTVHKWHVFRAGLRTGAPLFRLLIHDWTKYSLAEAPHYGRKHYGAKDDDLGFAYAWNNHSKAHKHHWEYWIPVTAHRLSPVKAGKPLPMPEWAVREMVADWIGASITYEGVYPQTLAEWTWFHKDIGKMKLHDETALLVAKVVAEYFSNPLKSPKDF